jgi:hypothetical protein
MRFLILSAVFTVVAVVVGYQVAGQSRVTAVISSLKRLNTAQLDYYIRHGRYAASINELAPELADGANGYRFRVSAIGNSYTIVAEPRWAGATFYTDETLVIRNSPEELNRK